MIRIAGLRKRFGQLEVLQGVDATFAAGRVTALVGPNAAGKTTLIKSILGLTRPDSGSITVNDSVVNGDVSYRRRIGYMPQIARFPGNLTGAELLSMLETLRTDVTSPDRRLIETFGLEPELDKQLRTLSGGTKQKLNAVAAFLFSPDVLILDEPTAGLDPRASSTLKDRILADRAAGRTFIVTSHVMAELEEVADDVIFLADGQVRFSGSLEGLKKTTRQVNLERAIAELMTRGKVA
ncbi:MAG TPA: ABC transporter ATP-binding protein [Gemmatimonadaceae bacterium]|nr:ABC transporter ATP-binding protein [Gemmatimonadaceae bacterium]